MASGISGLNKDGYEFLVPYQVVVYNNNWLAGKPNSVKLLATTEISGKKGTQLSSENGTKGKSMASGYDPMLLKTFGLVRGVQGNSMAADGFDSLGSPFRSGE